MSGPKSGTRGRKSCEYPPHSTPNHDRVYPICSHLNLIRSVTRILETTNRAMQEHYVTTQLPSGGRGRSDKGKGPALSFSDRLRLLLLRLQPLRDFEARLDPTSIQGLPENRELLYGYRSDIKELWADDVVQRILKVTKVQLEHSSGLYVSDGLCHPDYRLIQSF